MNKNGRYTILQDMIDEEREEEFAEDFSKEESNPKRQKALEKNARIIYDSDRD